MTRSNDFQDLTEKISVEEHVRDVERIAEALLSFHYVREQTYQMSFAKRGMVGVFMNLARKYDRLDALAEAYFQGEDPAALVDTLVDNAIYSLKWLALLGRLDAGGGSSFAQWISNVMAPEMGTTYEGARDMLFGESSEEDPLVEEGWDEMRNTLQKGGFTSWSKYEDWLKKQQHDE